MTFWISSFNKDIFQFLNKSITTNGIYIMYVKKLFMMRKKLKVEIIILWWNSKWCELMYKTIRYRQTMLLGEKNNKIIPKKYFSILDSKFRFNIYI